jgi:tRNA(Ile)-lysidine synthase
LYPLGFKPLQIKDIFHSLSGQPGKRFISPEWEAVRDREYLLLQTRTIESTTDPTPQLCIKTLDLSDDFIIPKEKDVACLDADKVISPLIIRKWQKGDKFVPFGMTGKKNVSDYLTDRKFSLFEKENQYVVCSDEKIIWLVGERSDNRFRITNTTKRVMIIRLQKER